MTTHLVTALRNRLVRIHTIRALIAARFDVDPSRASTPGITRDSARHVVTPACLRRDEVVQAVADALATEFKRPTVVSLRRDVKEAVEWLGGRSACRENRRLFVGIKPKAVTWRDAERKSHPLWRLKYRQTSAA